MIRNDRRRTPGRRSPERRHSVRTQLSAPGIVLGLVAMVIIFYQVWYLIQD